jgi:hypothetical protein
MHVSARGRHGGIELHAVMCARHEIGRAQQLCLSDGSRERKRNQQYQSINVVEANTPHECE